VRGGVGVGVGVGVGCACGYGCGFVDVCSTVCRPGVVGTYTVVGLLSGLFYKVSSLL